MVNPVEQLAGVAKANFGLCLRLAEITGEEGQECLRIGNKAMLAIADQGRAAATRVAPGEGMKSEAFDFFAEVQKGQKRIGGDIKSAVEDWQTAWLGALAPLSKPQVATDMVAMFFKPWLDNPATVSKAKPTTATPPPATAH